MHFVSRRLCGRSGFILVFFFRMLMGQFLNSRQDTPPSKNSASAPAPGAGWGRGVPVDVLRGVQPA